MPRSKKQPEYDPNELADLIGTPAVGSGVGSHLLVSKEVPDEVTTVVASNLATVVDSSVTTVVESLETPVDTTEAPPIVPGRKFSPPPDDSTSLIEVTTIASSKETIEDTSESPSVVTSVAGVLGRFWISESGEIVPESRVRRIATAADPLSSGEETLYQLLWNSPPVRVTTQARSIQAGYDSLTKQTGFSRKTIQRTIDRLTAKDYIEIETPADIYRRTPTIYRVYAEAAVLQRLARHDRTHVARIGPGVAFVTPLSERAD